MPSYLPTDVRIRLSACSLYHATTRIIIEKKGETAARQAETASMRLKGSTFLNEERVQFPGDSQNFGLNFLKNVPFKQVQVGADLFQVDPDTEEQERRGSMRSARVHANWKHHGHESDKEDVSVKAQRQTRAYPARSESSTGVPVAVPFADSLGDDMVPKALALHVMLGDQSFLRGHDDGKPQRCMIDVFFNGQLSSSVLVNWKEVHTWHQVFSGIRAGHMAERPWVILPPGQNADGSLRGFRRTVSVNERWQQIASALEQEVKARGVNKHGERPPSADYLHSLATMRMSEAVEYLQRPGGRRFGVIDVVITGGNGKKLNNGMSYLKTPMRIVDERYKKRSGEEDTSKSPARSSDRDAEGETDEEIVDEPPFPCVLAPPAPWLTMPLVPPPVNLPPFSGTVQPPQKSFALPSVPDISPSSAALPGSSSGQTSTEHASLSSLDLDSRQYIEGYQPYPISSRNSLFSDPNPVLDSSYPSLPHTQSRQVSFSHAKVASFNPREPPSNTAVGLEMSAYEVFPIPYSPNQIPPLAYSAASRRAPVLPGGNPINPFPLGQPPPVGFFSAPRSAVNLTAVAPATVDPRLPPLSVLLTRIVVTGKNGKRIVDHRWQVAQRIAMKKLRTRPVVSFSRSPTFSPMKNRQKSSGSEEYSDTSARARRKSRSSRRPTTPLSTSLPKTIDPDMIMSNDNMKRDSVHDGQVIRNSAERPLTDPGLFSIPESHLLGASTSMGDDANVFIGDGSATIPKRSATTSYHREPQTLPCIGVPGPRAAPSISEGPEKLLRRRARSPAKQDTRPVVVTSNPSQVFSGLESSTAATSYPSQCVTTSEAINSLESEPSSLSSAPISIPNASAPDSQGVNLLESGSSDLSSAPSSPEVALSQTIRTARLASVPLADVPDQPLTAEEHLDMPHTLLAAAVELLPVESQCAPSPSSAPNAPKMSSRTRRAVTTQATSVFMSQALPTVQPESVAPRISISSYEPFTSSTSETLLATFMPPKSPPKKKRRTTSLSSRMQPRVRNPEPPVDTSKNPPLNQDCVLAFAVTGTPGLEADGRVLRQIKSERQGVFEESEVVCGMRFFIAG